MLTAAAVVLALLAAIETWWTMKRRDDDRRLRAKLVVMDAMLEAGPRWATTLRAAMTADQTVLDAVHDLSALEWTDEREHLRGRILCQIVDAPEPC
jgi:hypothetical protein